ncbi:MAG: hypothetical protein OXR62_06360 [Ahrensia sp.]|nr:hypothetical protein [Ahrensia sp.]
MDDHHTPHSTSAGGIANGSIITRALTALPARLVEALLAAFFAGTVALVMALAVLRPSPNWDALPYFALALKQPGDEAATFHRRAYQAVQEIASPADFRELTQGNTYRKRQFEDPEAFASMLPMYAVKGGYVVALTALASRWGPYGAAMLINMAAAALLLSIVLWWMQQGGFLQAIPLLLMVLFALHFREVAGSVAPDFPAAALIITSIWLYSIKRDWGAIVPLALATTLRPDTLLLCIALIFVFAAMRQRLLPVVAGLVVSFAIYVWQTASADHMGWWAHYWFSTIRIQNTMAGFEPSFSLAAYLTGQARGVVTALTTFNWPFVGVALAFAWVVLSRSGHLRDRRAITLLTAILLAIGGKFITFPLPDDRIYMAFLIGAVMILANAWKPKPIPNRSFEDEPERPAAAKLDRP